jgi:hypothetical protein
VRFLPRVLPLIREMENQLLVPAPFAAVETLDWVQPARHHGADLSG